MIGHVALYDVADTTLAVERILQSKELLLKLREDAPKDLSGKKSILNRLETIAMGASSDVISAGILYLIGQIL